MSVNLEFVLINDFKCRRCGCTNYDKMIYTGDKTLDDEDPIIHEQYVCRNCSLPFTLVKTNKNVIEDVNMTSDELIKQSINNIKRNEGDENNAK